MTIRSVPTKFPNSEEHRRRLAVAINSMMVGRIKTNSTFTLTADAATTTVTDLNTHVDSVILAMPTTANAAAENLWFTVSKNSFVVNHANNSQTDRTFSYIVLGS